MALQDLGEEREWKKSRARMLPVREKWPFPEGESQPCQFTRTFSKKRPGLEHPEQFQDCSSLELDQQASPAEDHTAGLHPHVVNSPPPIPHATMWARPVSQPTTMGTSVMKRGPGSSISISTVDGANAMWGYRPVKNSPVLDQATDQVSEVLLKNSDSGTSLILQIKLAGCKIDAVIDTAAQVTVVSLDWIHSNRPDLELQSPVKLLNAAKSSQMTGWIIPQQDLVLGSSVFKIDVIAAPISDQMLLGLDFLKCYRIILDLGENTISVKDDRIVASGRKNGSRMFAVGQATMVCRAVVPLYSQQQVLVQPSCPSEQTFMLESSLRKKGLMVPLLLVTPTGQFPAVVRNDSERYVVLKKGHLLGTFTEMQRSTKMQNFLPSEKLDVTRDHKSLAQTLRSQST